MRWTCAAALILAASVHGQPSAPRALDIQFIDVEGGQATLVVTPSGESLLIDTGFPGNGDRDLNRVLRAIEHAGLKKVDYLLITHYHSDHVGNAAAIAGRIPVGTFIDHGESIEKTDEAKALYDGYVKARASGKHMLAKPGDRVPLHDLDVTIVASDGRHIAAPLPGAGAPNPLCTSFKPQDPDPSENARSIGAVIAFGRFRMLDLGDLTWNKEHELACPNDLIGPIDLYLTTHHWLFQSGPEVLVHGVRPRVAIMNNGATKGGSASAMQIVRSSPGLVDFWQLHQATGAEGANMPPAMIANLDESTAYAITVSARRDGGFSVTNARTKETRRYPARSAY